jgi:hypothetical protein
VCERLPTLAASCILTYDADDNCIARLLPADSPPRRAFLRWINEGEFSRHKEDL